MAGVDPDRWLQDMQAKVDDLSAKSAQLREDMANSSATVLSKDHAVQVTIAPTGALQNIQITDHAVGMSPQRLQASIMEAVAKGQRAASEKMIEAFAPIGVGTESMDLVMSYLPPAVEDEDDAEQHGYDDDGYAVEHQEPAAPPPAPTRQPRPAHDDDDEDGQPW
ncbi:YbaB/EbfC family nucleoid-associated protein [Lentzea sp. PSKA42]|uniref:YbaB/EbfC family nucleoid-associated protein n=1 Tax=Lentzea indica TaxID=2604800 RepID=A0ABX1FSG2_9PSEU|nr:YbaB/EbfC family nucleoid-associated protein [Lentzea indica]NKE61922.1 YbaB/EbfC family nucleoid-associated protein [Lentzea indica]